jgi:hypothetical protein
MSARHVFILFESPAPCFYLSEGANKEAEALEGSEREHPHAMPRAYIVQLTKPNEWEKERDWQLAWCNDCACSLSSSRSLAGFITPSYHYTRILTRHNNIIWRVTCAYLLFNITLLYIFNFNFRHICLPICWPFNYRKFD